MANNTQAQMQTSARPAMARQPTQPMPGQPANPPEEKKSKLWLWIIIAVVILILIGLGLWFFLG
jgi:cytoskeletal protein RodZ